MKNKRNTTPHVINNFSPNIILNAVKTFFNIWSHIMNCNKSPSYTRIYVKRLIREAVLCWLYQADLESQWEFNSDQLNSCITAFIDAVGQEIIEQEKLEARKIYNAFLLCNDMPNDATVTNRLFEILPLLDDEDITPEFLLDPVFTETESVSDIVSEAMEEDEEIEQEIIIPLTEQELCLPIFRALLQHEMPKYIHLAIQHKDEIDQKISTNTTNWELHELTYVDRNLLRLASVEILYMNVEPKVVANEIIEIAKDYSKYEAPKFINGVIANLFPTNS